MQSEIDSLRETNSKLLAKITELRKENAEVKAENVKLKHALEEHEARFTSLEQRDEEKATLIAKLDDDIKEIKQSSASTSSAENSDIPICTETKSLEEKETDAFLNEVHKKIVGNEIRKRNKEKKLQRESAIQEMPSISQNTTSNCYERKNKQGASACEDLIKEISTSISCNSSIQNLRGTSHGSISQVTEISLTSGQGKSDILQNIANLYEKACDAEDVSIKANQAEILCWSNFIIAFDKSIEKIMSFMARDIVGMKKAKGLIYNFILAQNPGTKRPALYKKIERARKIYRLTEKIGLDKVKYIKTYSANTISKFTNEEIQRVIDHFTENHFTDDFEDIEQDNKVLEELDQNNVLEILLPKESTAPIPLAHDSVPEGPSNSSDNSKKVDPSNSLEAVPSGSAEDDYYKMLLGDCAKDCVYFDSAPQSVKGTNEKEMPDDSPKAEVTTSHPQIPITNPTYDRAYFCNKILDQYPNLFREGSSENFDYYGITDETSCGDYICPLCKLGHDDEEIGIKQDLTLLNVNSVKLR